MRYTTKKFRNKVRERLLNILKLKQISKSEIVENSKIRKSTFYKILQKNNPVLPTLDNLEIILKYLKIKPKDFFDFNLKVTNIPSYSYKKQTLNFKIIVASQIKKQFKKREKNKNKSIDFYFSKERLGEKLGKEEYSKYIKKICNPPKRKYKNLKLETIYYIAKIALKIPIYELFKIPKKSKLDN